MMGRLNHDQRQLFYSFRLDEVVPDDHLVRAIASVLDLSWVHKEFAPYYPTTGRPSIDPVLMIRMLIVGYIFAIRSERALCRDVQVNLAYRWFCGLSIEDKIPDHSAFSRARGRITHIGFEEARLGRSTPPHRFDGRHRFLLCRQSVHANSSTSRRERLSDRHADAPNRTGY